MATKAVQAKSNTKGKTPALATPAKASRPPVNTGRTTAPPARAAKSRPAPAPAPEPEEEIIEEGTDEAPVEEVASEEFARGQSDVAGEDEGQSGDEILDLSTDELDSPSRKADAHRGHIVEIVEWHSEQKGTPAFRIVLHSDDADFDSNWDCYVPFPFEENIRISPKDLSKGQRNEETGKMEGNEQMQYAMTIHNKKNDATVDRLRTIARGEGRSLADYQEPVESFSDYCAVLNHLGAGLPVVFRRNPDRQNPRFLRVEDILPIGAVEDPKSQGLFKGRVKAWESQE